MMEMDAPLTALGLDVLHATPTTALVDLQMNADVLIPPDALDQTILGLNLRVAILHGEPEKPR